MGRGLFITVEGTDGSGKTTQIKLMMDYVKASGHDVILTREPGGTPIGEKIRSIILDPANTEMHDTTELMLYSAARAQIVEQIIRPNVEGGKIVICDRYIDSFFAYQGYGRGQDISMLSKITDIAINGLMPNITFFFDLDPEIGIRRRVAATGSDRIESEQIEFHKRVYEGYKELAKKYPKRIRTIDACRSIDDVWHDVKLLLDVVLAFGK